MRLRVVCGLEVTMAIFCPTRRFSRVDLPALGRPMMATKPERNPGLSGTGMWAVVVSRISLGRRFRVISFCGRDGCARGPSRGRLRHVPAIFLQLAQNEFALVGAARFVQRGIRMLR